ncbi:MAG: helix-turn-helix domain-containing protein [Candidatus Cryptobacteroides sp.]
MERTLEIGIGSLPSLMDRRLCAYRYSDSVEVLRLDGSQLNSKDLPDISDPLRMDAMNIFLTLSGNAFFEVDSVGYELIADTTLTLIGVRTLRNVRFSDDFTGWHLMVSKSFYDDIFREGKHLTPQTAVFKTSFPFDHIGHGEAMLLDSCIKNIISTMGRVEHIWYHRMIATAVQVFFLEMGNIIISRMQSADEGSLSNHDLLFFRFLQLTRDNGTERKPVRFYADKLCLSPDYLARSIKQFSHKPITYWINDALMAQAKILLADSRLTIQQIVEKMNFADQSSFGRFFKKNSGKSPAEYRRLLK